jgi:cation:H+ antiporter
MRAVSNRISRMNDLGLAIAGIVAGLVVLVAGGELLVQGASRLAASLRIPPLVIGLTVVAFGTSSPELAVSVQSAWVGNADLAVGNVVGSNIFNVLFILGLSALIAPLSVASQLVRRDVPLMIAASLLLLLLGFDGHLGRDEGVLLFAGLLGFTWWCVLQSRRESRAATAADPAGDEPERPTPNGLTGSTLGQLAAIAGGLVLLGIGSKWLIDGAVSVATFLGVSELIIGLTIVAAGTSLPELATSLMAAWRGERDIAVGNVVGSNLFNILGVLGLASIIAPSGIEVSQAALSFDLPVMIAAAVACLPIFFTGHCIARWEGGLFLGYYVAYTACLVLGSMNHPASRTLTSVMLGFVLPLTAVTLLVEVYRTRRHEGASGNPPSSAT